jgi:hypothetical protein
MVTGTACLVSPRDVLAAVGGSDSIDDLTGIVTRVLGARLVAQAGLDLILGPSTRRLDVAVDLTHAASMLPLAVLSPRHRRTALFSAAVATTTAILSLLEPPESGSSA